MLRSSTTEGCSPAPAASAAAIVFFSRSMSLFSSATTPACACLK
jgi:hypothetical protein